ncbi:uncharacterized protein SCHCODRAFT_02034083 [Schizophyllum commune H4-8]|uniref:uncharacterized protein n=1 Tax=Schizophyllum commune (strain H4-8 / FGSC 9210) TaxID=578458 RepID=UPI0021610768|nr:uncharacterized protein SCHCODRAFT_02034083 [Schizophyllum commune H4-8]KAI5900333.1 hypothetical protein SCHCODRAFT_02034083 [Schizophyllum commune H4-8]
MQTCLFRAASRRSSLRPSACGANPAWAHKCAVSGARILLQHTVCATRVASSMGGRSMPSIRLRCTLFDHHIPNHRLYSPASASIHQARSLRTSVFAFGLYFRDGTPAALPGCMSSSIQVMFRRTLEWSNRVWYGRMRRAGSKRTSEN